MGLRVGGVVVPYTPSYFGGSSTVDVTHQEGASDANNSDAAANTSDGSASASLA